MGVHGEGLYVVFEGCESSGKSTQTARAAGYFGGILTRETGGTFVGRSIRGILHDPSMANMLPETEAFLAAADRAQHIREVVAPHLDAGRDVFSDRSWVSSLVYQGIAGKAGIELVQKLTELAIGPYKNPDLLFIIDIPFSEYEQRQNAKGRGDRFEQKDLTFHRDVLVGYREVALELGAVMLDGTKPIEELADEVKVMISEKKEDK